MSFLEEISTQQLEKYKNGFSCNFSYGNTIENEFFICFIKIIVTNTKKSIAEMWIVNEENIEFHKSNIKNKEVGNLTVGKRVFGKITFIV